MDSDLGRARNNPERLPVKRPPDFLLKMLDSTREGTAAVSDTIESPSIRVKNQLFAAALRTPSGGGFGSPSTIAGESKPTQADKLLETVVDGRISDRTAKESVEQKQIEPPVYNYIPTSRLPAEPWPKSAMIAPWPKSMIKKDRQVIAKEEQSDCSEKGGERLQQTDSTARPIQPPCSPPADLVAARQPKPPNRPPPGYELVLPIARTHDNPQRVRVDADWFKGVEGELKWRELDTTLDPPLSGSITIVF